jgi:hypothetical protein
MNLKQLAGTAALAASLGLPAAAMAQQDDPNQQAAPPGSTTTTMEKNTELNPEDLRKVTITVKSVDRSKNMVTFQAKVAPEANIESNGQPIRLNELKPGDSVRASFDPSTGDLIKLEVTRMGHGKMMDNKMKHTREQMQNSKEQMQNPEQP